MLLIYNILFPLAIVFFLPGIIYKLIKRPGRKSTFLERFALYTPAKKKALREARGAIWVHAVSVGETQVAVTLIRQWQKK